MPGDADKGAPSDVTEDQTDDGVMSPDQKNAEQLNAPMPGSSKFNPETLKTPSESKATSPILLAEESEHEKSPERDAEDTFKDILQGMKIEKIGPFATRWKFEETKNQYERMGEVMKERAVMTMMECLTLQLQQQLRMDPSRPTLAPFRGITQDVHSTSLTPLSSSYIRSALAPQSVRTLASEASINLAAAPPTKGKPATKLNKLLELEKQVNNLEKQCRILDRHLREHDRDQKSMQSKIHCLEMKILHDGQKQVIWDMMEKIPTEEDLKTISSFHSFALERKRTESQIQVLNVRVKALNTAMGKMTTDPLQTGMKISLDDPYILNQPSLARVDLPDFTTMTLEEREEFFRKSGVTLYEYDKETPEPEERQPKSRSKKSKTKKVNILEDPAPETAPKLKVSKRKNRGSDDGNDAQSRAASSKLKSAKSSRTSKLILDSSSDQNINLAENNQLAFEGDRQSSGSELMSSLAAENPLRTRETSPSLSENSDDGSESGSTDREVPQDGQKHEVDESSPDGSDSRQLNGK